MYSFYGGQPGNSFIIITTYRSIADMVDKFKLGSEYTAVHFDQYVMINTVNKNDPDNGKVYRRGYDFNNKMGGAEFVGTIVGPSGNAPMLQMATIAEIKKKAAAEGYQERHSSGSYSISGQNLVPGKTPDGTFNDAIKWECCSIRNENNEDTTAYIGFSFPYTVIDVEASTTEPYMSGKYADTSGAYRIDDYMHPFYEKWHLDIPRGVKGDSFKNLKVQVADMTIQPYDGQADDINNQCEVLVYEYYNYESLKTGNPKKIYLGDYFVIKDISVANDGTVTVSYNHTDKHFNKMMKWINNVSVSDDGTLTIKWNNGSADTTFNKKIQWVSSINLSDTGIFSVIYNTGKQTTFEPKIKWIKNINLANANLLNFIYNDNSSQSIELTFPNDLDIDTGETEGAGSQKVQVKLTDGTSYEIGNPINYIMQAAVDENEHLLVRYSDPERRSQEGTITWNDKTGWTNIGNLKVPYVYTDPTATDLQWSGLGVLTNSEDEYMNITFTIPLTQFLDSNISSIETSNGELYVQSQNGTHDLTGITLDSTNTIITKTLSGLKFQIQTTFANLETATIEIVSVLVNGLNLNFIRPTPQQ